MRVHSAGLPSAAGRRRLGRSPGGVLSPWAEAFAPSHGPMLPDQEG